MRLTGDDKICEEQPNQFQNTLKITQYLNYQSLIQYITMFKNNLRPLIFCILALCVLCDIELRLQSTQATAYANSKVLIKFKVIGATTPYSIKYGNLPNSWSAVNNDLVISNFKQGSSQDWTLDININAAGITLTQTLRIFISGPQVKIYPITIPKKTSSSSSTNSKPGQSGSTFSLNDLINRYPGLKQEGYAFGFNPVASSIVTPIIIANSQALYNSSRDARQITPYEIKRNAAILRQTNADKAIANLIFIITNLNKNIGDAKNSMNIQTNRLQYMKDVAFNCSEDTFKLENTIAKIKNAIDDRKTKIVQQKTQIDSVSKTVEEFKANTTVLMNQKWDIEKSITPEGLSLIIAEKKITQCQQNLKNITSQAQSVQNTIRNNNLEINIIKDNTEDSNNKLKNVNSSLDIVRQKITELKKQLAEAQDQEFSLMKDQVAYMSIPVQSKVKITNLERRNADLALQYQNLTNKSTQQQKICEQSKVDVQAQKQVISQREMKYSLILNRIEDFKNKTADLESEIKQRTINTDGLTAEVNALNRQLQKTSLLLFQQNYVCSVAEEKKAKQQSKLDELGASIDESTKALADSNQYLELARAEKQLADLGVEQIIQQSTNATLFAFAPNGGSIQLGGTPLGNNPSGSALGPSFRVDSIEMGYLEVTNLTYFLSTVYEMNIDPTQILKALVTDKSNLTAAGQSLATVYTLDSSSRSQIVNKTLVASANLSNFKCESSSILQSRSGFIEQVTLGSLKVRDTFDQKYTLSISSCTKIASTKSGNFFATGNKIYFTGVQLFNIFSNTLFDAYSVLIVPV